MTNWKPQKQDDKFNAADLLGAVIFVVFIFCIMMLPAILDEFL